MSKCDQLAILDPIVTIVTRWWLLWPDMPRCDQISSRVTSYGWYQVTKVWPVVTRYDLLWPVMCLSEKWPKIAFLVISGLQIAHAWSKSLKKCGIARPFSTSNISVISQGIKSLGPKNWFSCLSLWEISSWSILSEILSQRSLMLVLKVVTWRSPSKTKP